MKRKGWPFGKKAAGYLFCLILIAAGCGLGGVALSVQRSRDTSPPTISCPAEEMEYTIGEDQSLLLAGLTATDMEDGDVTASIRVRNISIASDRQSAIVTYVARDQSNNMGITKRSIRVRNEEKQTVQDSFEVPSAGEAIEGKLESDGMAEMEGTP